MSIFDEKSSKSSLRVNLFIVTIPIALILLSIAFHVAYRTVVPFKIVVDAISHVQQVIMLPIEWATLAVFSGAIFAGYLSLLYGKERNKNAETNQMISMKEDK